MACAPSGGFHCTILDLAHFGITHTQRGNWFGLDGAIGGWNASFQTIQNGRLVIGFVSNFEFRDRLQRDEVVKLLRQLAESAD